MINSYAVLIGKPLNMNWTQMEGQYMRLQTTLKYGDKIGMAQRNVQRAVSLKTLINLQVSNKQIQRTRSMVTE